MPNKKKTTSRETGTVPKVIYWNNTIQHDSHVSNNLTSSMLPNQDRPHSGSRIRQRCSNYQYFEGVSVGGDDLRITPNYNSLPFINMSEGTTSPSTSGSTSRRHSGGAIRKCDNITKYPDKKQIEDKLSQIREYLKVTSSLMSSVKDDQSDSGRNDELFHMLSALRDSERKLEALLTNKQISHSENFQSSNALPIEIHENGLPTLNQDMFPTYQNNVTAQRNELEQKMEISEKKLHALHEHQSLLMRLQEKAENQLRDARKAQERLAACANSVPFPGTQQEMKNSEKNRCSELSQAAELTSQAELNLMQATNEGRGQLLQLLDARDNELCAEQLVLQLKLQELTSKKQQIDQLVTQLHCYGGGGDTGSEEGDDMANQIRQIVVMKEQLATLKDMLSAVKSKEADLIRQNSVEPVECPDQVVKTDKVFSDCETRSDSERRWAPIEKESNKSSISSSGEHLQTELQAKKQELEELMYKDHYRTSAINQDVCNELVMNKTEQSFSATSVPSSWTLLHDIASPLRDSYTREDVYSSDEDDLENYSQLNNVHSTKPVDFINSNFSKQASNSSNVNCNPIMQDAPSCAPINHNFNQFTGGVDYKQQFDLMANLCQNNLEQQRQMVQNQFSTSNHQYYNSFMQMQQALMLSTISQCCQLLWLQQQDISNLTNTIAMMQQYSKPIQTINISEPSTETLGSARSLPTRLPSNNTEYIEMSTRERSSPQNASRRNTSAQSFWKTTPTLNNQVAPGNRANNYWDNFRSYSRQNLLSAATKSNEGSQNSFQLYDQRNINGTVCQPIRPQRSQQSLPKINTPIQEGCTDHESQYRSTNRERIKSSKRNRHPNRNVWQEDNPPQDNSPPKPKLFDAFKEKIYKEVTLLISANENRPQFLIQLFKDLQLVSSDPLRRNALQSIHSVINQSLNDWNATSLNYNGTVSSEERLEVPAKTDQATSTRNKFEKPRCHLQPIVDPSKLDPDIQLILIELLPVLKSNNDDVFHNGLVDIMKTIIFQNLPNKHVQSNNKLQTKLELKFNDFFSKFKGKRINEIKEQLIKAIADILIEEFTIKERQNSECESKPNESNSNVQFYFLGESSNPITMEPLQYLPVDHRIHPDFSNAPRIDNGDLAEADQSRREAESEEGAVGGILEPPNAHDSNSDDLLH